MPDRSQPYYRAHVFIDDEKWSDLPVNWGDYVSQLTELVLKQFDWNRDVEVNVKLTNNKEIQELNQAYRHKDKPTNVLSFPAMDDADISRLPEGFPILLGDIALAYEVIQQEALEQNKVFLHHINHLIVHGLLHLLGYDHEIDSEAEEMEALEIDILSKQSIPNPYEE